MDVEYTSAKKAKSNKECTFWQNFKKTANIYWYNTSYGHLDQIRVDLEQSYKGLQDFILMKNGGIIDTMWIANEANKGNPHTPTVMFCNPNGVFYETFAYDGYWLEFYMENGFNIFLWNYRGYGRSTGSISPNNLFSDADELVKFLKDVRGVGKLLVHGISLGGGVASHLSNNPLVDCVFADRTFSSLDSVIRDDFGKTLRVLYNIFTFGKWKMHCAKKFLNSEKYKIVSSDPQDEMIPELSSLKNGIARAALENAIVENMKVTKKKLHFNDIVTILEKNEVETMFSLLQEIFTLSLNKAEEDYSKSKSKKAWKKNEDENPNASIELNFLDTETDKLESGNGFNISGTNYSAHSESYLDKTTGKLLPRGSIIDRTSNELTGYFITNYHTPCQNALKVTNIGSQQVETSLVHILNKHYTPNDAPKIENFLSKIKRAL